MTEEKKEVKEKPPAKAEEPKESAREEEPAEKLVEKGEKKGEKKGEEEEKKIIKESLHTISLRKAFDHPRTSRAKYAAREVRDYIRKHTRKEPFLDPSVNEAIWEKGIQSPPRRLKVKIQEEEARATAVMA